jgi:DNA ligase (NAD+)
MSTQLIDEVKQNPVKWASEIELDKLLETLKQLSFHYYNTKDELVEDSIFDLLVDTYNSRSKTKFSYIGSKVDDTDKVKLPVHMGSMDKTKTIEGVQKWYKKQTNTDFFVITPKIDGTSALITYQLDKDELNIYTRGDGFEGKRINFLNPIFFNSEIKANVIKYLDSNKKNEFICRGEMIVKKSVFEKFKNDFKSSRSMVNGITNKKEINEKSSKALNVIEFMLFEIIDPDIIPSDQIKIAKSLGFIHVPLNLVAKKHFIKNFEYSIVEQSHIGKNLIDYRDNYDYDIDGIIITSNKNYTLPDTGNPEYSIAFKINQSGLLTKVTNVEWNVSKHGQLIPTLMFESIILGSSRVTKCTGFNGAFILNNNIGPGAIIRVVLSGEVIPTITEIVTPVSIPQMPDCEYKWNETKIQCEVVEDTNELAIQKIVNFIKTIKIDYLAQGMISHLHKNGFTTLKSILTISKKDLLQLDRIEQKMADKIIESINDKISKPIELSLLMDGSLCFGHGFGVKRCSQIINAFPNFMEITPSSDSIINIPGWSDKSICKFNEGLPKFKQFMIENDFLIPEIKSKSKTNNGNNEDNGNNGNNDSNKLKKICITGKRDPKIIKFMTDNDIELISTITTDLDILICEDKTRISGKVKQAQKRGKEILTIDEFKDLYSI